MIEILGLHALMGSSIPIAKYLLAFTKPIFFSGIRMFVAGFILLGYTYWRKNKNKLSPALFNRTNILLYAQIICIGAFGKCVLRYWGLSYMSAVKTAFILNASPFMAALLSYIICSERLSLKQWIGLCIGFFGLTPIFITSSYAEQLGGELFFFSWPELAVLVAVFCHNYGMITARKLIRDNNQPTVLVNGIRMFGGGSLALLTAFFFEEFVPIDNVASFAGWLMVLVFTTHIISYNFYLSLLKRYSVTFLSFADFLCPIFASIYGWFFLGETVSWHYYASAAIVFSGLSLFYQDELYRIKGTKKDERKRRVADVTAQPKVAWSAKGRSR